MSAVALDAAGFAVGHPSGHALTLSTASRAVLAIAIAMQLLVTTFFLMRVYVAWRVMQIVHIEDVSCSVTWALYITHTILMILVVTNGGGLPESQVTMQEYSTYQKWLYVSSLTFVLTSMFGKLTLLLILRRISLGRATSAADKAGVLVLLIVVVLWFLPVFVLRIVGCDAFQGGQLWDPRTPAAKGSACTTFLRLAPSIGSIPIDFAILAVPVALVHSQKHMSVRRKARIIFVLSTGGFATAFSVWRLVQLLHFQSQAVPDATTPVVLSIADMLEVGLGLLCACLPAVGLLCRWSHNHRQATLEHANVPRSGLLSRRRRRRMAGMDSLEAGQACADVAVEPEPCTPTSAALTKGELLGEEGEEGEEGAEWDGTDTQLEATRSNTAGTLRDKG